MSETAISTQRHVGVDLPARTGVYLLFARLLREAPSEALLREIVQSHLLTLAEQWGRGELPLDPAEDPRWPLQAEEIAVEYARLFAVPGEQAVHPYESAYCDILSIDTSTACSAYFPACAAPGIATGGAAGGGSQRPSVGLPGFIGGPSAAAVRDAYARGRFKLAPASHELPDHLAIELEFMGRLLERGDGDHARVFFSEHLGRWALRCLADVKQQAHSAFYRTVADSLTVFLRHEQGRLTAQLPGYGMGVGRG